MEGKEFKIIKSSDKECVIGYNYNDNIKYEIMFISNNELDIDLLFIILNQLIEERSPLDKCITYNYFIYNIINNDDFNVFNLSKVIVFQNEKVFDCDKIEKTYKYEVKDKYMFLSKDKEEINKFFGFTSKEVNKFFGIMNTEDVLKEEIKKKDDEINIYKNTIRLLKTNIKNFDINMGQLAKVLNELFKNTKDNVKTTNLLLEECN